MKAVWLEDNTLSYRNDVPSPEPGPQEALVQVSRAGICATDLELVKGYYPFGGIPGHEFVGAIVQAPDRPERVGQRVVGEINISCGVCPTCLAGRKNHCPRRTVMGIVDHHGAFAEYVCLPLVNLVPVPDTVSDETAVFVEPLAAALEIREQIPITATDKVLVLGAGRLGQLIAQSLIPTGCHLKVSARYEKQQKLLVQKNVHIIVGTCYFRQRIRHRHRSHRIAARIFHGPKGRAAAGHDCFKKHLQRRCAGESFSDSGG